MTLLPEWNCCRYKETHGWECVSERSRVKELSWIGLRLALTGQAHTQWYRFVQWDKKPTQCGPVKCSRWPRSFRFILRLHWELLSIRSIKDDSVEVSILSENIKTYTMLWVVPLSGESLVKLSSGKGFCYVRFSTLLRACRGLGMAQILAGWNAKPLSWKWVQVMTRIDWFV